MPVGPGSTAPITGRRPHGTASTKILTTPLCVLQRQLVAYTARPCGSLREESSRRPYKSFRRGERGREPGDEELSFLETSNIGWKRGCRWARVYTTFVCIWQYLPG